MRARVSAERGVGLVIEVVQGEEVSGGDDADLAGGIGTQFGRFEKHVQSVFPLRLTMPVGNSTDGGDT